MSGFGTLLRLPDLLLIALSGLERTLSLYNQNSTGISRYRKRETMWRGL